VSLRPWLQRIPRPLLIAIAALTLPLHLAIHVVIGIVKGYQSWSDELRAVTREKGSTV
jgi:hypothetical protein